MAAYRICILRKTQSADDRPHFCSRAAKHNITCGHDSCNVSALGVIELRAARNANECPFGHGDWCRCDNRREKVDRPARGVNVWPKLGRES